MQYWTKIKPTQTGYYWAKLNENETCIVFVSVSEETYVTIGDEVFPINHSILSSALWGNAKISEPQGLKI